MVLVSVDCGSLPEVDVCSVDGNLALQVEQGTDVDLLTFLPATVREHSGCTYRS